MSELSRLMLKAVRSLPPEEQDALLEALLEPRLAPWPGPGMADPGPAGPGLSRWPSRRGSPISAAWSAVGLSPAGLAPVGLAAPDQFRARMGQRSQWRQRVVQFVTQHAQ